MGQRVGCLLKTRSVVTARRGTVCVTAWVKVHRAPALLALGGKCAAARALQNLVGADGGARGQGVKFMHRSCVIHRDLKVRTNAPLHPTNLISKHSKFTSLVSIKITSSLLEYYS